MIPVTRAEARRQWGNLTPFGQLVVQVAATALVSFGLVLVAGTCAPAEGPQPAALQHEPIVPPASYVVAEAADREPERPHVVSRVVPPTPAVPATEHEEVQREVARGVGASDAGVGAVSSSALPTPGPAPHELARADVAQRTERGVPNPEVAGPTPAVSSTQLTEDEVYAAALAVSGSEQWAREAVAITWCESRWQPGAVGAAGERGIYQLHPVHGPIPDGLLARTAMAYALWLERGWQPWDGCRGVLR